MKRIFFAAAAALAFATAAGATSPPYYKSHGVCTSPDGHQVPQAQCTPAPRCKSDASRSCGITCRPIKRCHGHAP